MHHAALPARPSYTPKPRYCTAHSRTIPGLLRTWPAYEVRGTMIKRRRQIMSNSIGQFHRFVAEIAADSDTLARIRSLIRKQLRMIPQNHLERSMFQDVTIISKCDQSAAMVRDRACACALISSQFGLTGIRGFPVVKPAFQRRVPLVPPRSYCGNGRRNEADRDCSRTVYSSLLRPAMVA